MLTDIFSGFDLGTNLAYKAYPFRTLLLLSLSLTWMSNYWAFPNPLGLVVSSFNSYLLSGFFKGAAFNLKSWASYLTSVFFLLVHFNLVGLIPYVYGLTCQPYMTFSISWPIWFALVISSPLYNFNSYSVGYVPTGCPLALANFTGYMEGLSSLTRLMSLGFRLMASMSMGHVLCEMGGHFFISLPVALMLIILPIMAGIYLMEVGMCVLQAWVFFFLSKSYTEEHSKLSLS